MRIYQYKCIDCKRYIEKQVQGRISEPYEIKCGCGGRAVKVVV
jgi:hypothetical protein